MEKLKIGVFDSGIGGVGILKETIKLLPNAQYVYLSDSINNPYGDKSSQEILEIVLKNVSFLQDKGCKIIVIACNTATAVAIDVVREKFPELIIIGTEPAIKCLYDDDISLISGITLLLATKMTLESERIYNLLERYPVSNLVPISCIGLADLIEDGNMALIEEYIKDNIAVYKDVTALILGCTHYPLVKPLFQKYFPNAKIFDGNQGVARQVERKALEISLPMTTYSLEFYDTKDTAKKRQQLTNYFSIEL